MISEVGPRSRDGLALSRRMHSMISTVGTTRTACRWPRMPDDVPRSDGMLVPFSAEENYPSGS